MTKIYSTRFSLDGWDAWTWFKGNWKTVKEVGKVFVPLIITWIATSSPSATFAVTVIGKALLDVVEYYVKEY